MDLRSIRIVLLLLLYIITIYSYYIQSVYIYIYAYAKHFITIGYYSNLNITFLSNLIFLIPVFNLNIVIYTLYV